MILKLSSRMTPVHPSIPGTSKMISVRIGRFIQVCGYPWDALGQRPMMGTWSKSPIGRWQMIYKVYTYLVPGINYDNLSCCTSLNRGYFCMDGMGSRLVHQGGAIMPWIYLAAVVVWLFFLAFHNINSINSINSSKSIVAVVYRRTIVGLATDEKCVFFSFFVFVCDSHCWCCVLLQPVNFTRYAASL